jgi:recombinational DNA repair ATPase RecF
MSDTPRTDAASWREHQQSVVDADFARQLERELAQRTAERDRMTGQRNAALDAREITQRTLDGIDGVLSQRTAERDEARREVCALWEKHQTWAHGVTASDYAVNRGWDCFKEEVK